MYPTKRTTALFLALVFVLGLTQVRAVIPVNDTCSGAEVIPSAGPFPHLTTLISDIGAATSEGDPENLCADISNGVWYRFTPAQAGDYTFSVATDTATTVEDTVLAIYTSTGGCGGVFEEVDCIDDEAGLKAAISVRLDAGTTYYIVAAVGPNGLTPGLAALQMRVTLPVVPANDTCSGAVVVPSAGPFPYLTPVTDITLAGEAGDPPFPSCGDALARSVWFRFTPAANSIFEFSTCGDTATTVYDLFMAVYTSAAGCGGPFTEVACAEDGCGNQPSTQVTLTAGVTYYVVIWESFQGVADELTYGETSVQLKVKQLLPPTVLTGGASSISSSGAIVSGQVNPNGLQTIFWFEWGLDAGYGFATPPRLAGSGELLTPQESFISLFAPGLPHHYRLVATNLLGRTDGPDRMVMWQETAPEVSGATPLANGTVQVQFQAVAGQLYYVEATGDFQEWILIGTANDLGNGTFTFVDTGAAGLTRRFYRALAP